MPFFFLFHRRTLRFLNEMRKSYGKFLFGQVDLGPTAFLSEDSLFPTRIVVSGFHMFSLFALEMYLKVWLHFFPYILLAPIS